MRTWFLLLFLLGLASPQAQAGQTLASVVNIQALKNAPANANHSTDTIDAYAYAQPMGTGLSFSASTQCDWASLTGTIDATVALSVSNDGATWVPKTAASFTLSGATGTQVMNINGGITELYYQLVYTANDVTGGTISCWFVSK